MNGRTSRGTPHAAIWDALLDYQQSPGRHSVAMREPRVLFDNTLTLLMLAADRHMELPGGQSPPQAVRQAARYFVRTAMLRPANDHYTLMGVKPETDIPTLREHYRLLMRLTHPDFLNKDDAWPVDAAARVNRAHDALSSSDKRAAYDAQQAKAMPPISVATPKTAPVRDRHVERVRPRTGTYLSAALAMCALGALVLLWPTPEDTSLTVMPTVNRSVALATSPTFEGAPQVSNVETTRGIDVASSKPPALTPLPMSSGVASRNPVTKAVLVHAPPHPPQAEPTTTKGAWGLSYVLSLPSKGSTPASALSDQSARVAPSPAPPLPDTETLTLTMDRTPSLGERKNTHGDSKDMQQLQPVLTDLLHMLGTGQSDRVQVWVARNAQHDTSAASFASAYRQVLAGAVVTGLGESQFDLRRANGQPVVHGNVQIRLVGDNQQTQLKNFRLRAHFVMLEDGPRLARLDAE